ncbi:DUF6232 family protein [Promicromonospora sp. NPDC060271]|uniref:DUF6232 family protein n=1 Tax=Promicromonospora sp. NPDC060271 TaxID=3347089 RepID=UPI0036650F1D
MTIERGHLHVGSDTYPLRNVARIGLRSFIVSPAPPPQWVLAMILAGGIGTPVTGYLVFGDDGGIAGDAPVWLWFLGALGLLVLGVFLLIRLRSKPQKLTVLEVISSGTPHRALVSDDTVGLTGLKREMEAAINDLSVTYHQEFRQYDISAGNFIGEIHAGGTGFVQQSS